MRNFLEGMAVIAFMLALCAVETFVDWIDQFIPWHRIGAAALSAMDWLAEATR
jgi:hypothetical protein